MGRMCAVVALLILIGFAPAGAQTGSTGGINGKVVDNTGGALPGVNITISSPALMGTRTTVTNEEGAYRFPAVPPGEYTIVYELAGFQTVRREGIRVTIGFTATVNPEMGMASLQETVTVTGQSPVVDSQSTTMTTTFDKAVMNDMPIGSRDFWGLLAQTPSVVVSKFDVGGSAAMTVLPVNVYGITGQERPLVEGIISNSSTGGVGFSFYGDYGSFEEVSISTAGHSAETGSPGLFTNLISKAGGNTYHGSIYADYQDSNMQTRNISADQIAKGVTGGGALGADEVNRTDGWRDFNIGGGGFIVKDKLWWYGSLRDMNFKQWYTNYPPEPQESRGRNYAAKLTYQLSTNNKLFGYYQYTGKLQENRFDAYRLSATAALNVFPESTVKQDYNSGVWKVEFNRVMGSSMFFEMRGGGYWFHFPFERKTEALRYEDVGNSRVYGGNQNRVQDRYRPQVLGSLSYTKDGWYGTHNFKLGGNILKEWQDQVNEGFPEQILHVMNNGQPREVYLFQPGANYNGLYTYSAYLNDSWQLPKRLTLNLGARFDRFRAFTPEQVHPASRFNPTEIVFPAVDNWQIWNHLAPRVGATYALTADSKNVLKFNYARYYYDPGNGLAGSLNPNDALWFRRYAWSDPNKNGRWDPGEEGRLIQTTGGVASTRLDPDLQNTYANEMAAWFERELITDVGFRGGLVWRGVRQEYARINLNMPFEAFTVPVTIVDPGPDGVRGNADDGPGIAGFQVAPEYLGRTSLNQTSNIPLGGSNYLTYEFTVTKRPSHGWSAAAAFSLMKNAHNGSEFPEGQAPNTVRSNALPLNPNDLINTDNGRYKFTMWTGNVKGAYQFPWDVKISGTLRHQSGPSYGRTFTTSLNYSSSVRVLAEPMDTHRQRNVTIVDLRLEKGFHLNGSFRVAALLDGFNMLNSNAEERISWNSGASYLRPLQIIPPRVFRVGVRVDF